MKNKTIFQKWEHAVQSATNGNEWRATRHSLVCGRHFEQSDYTLPPSINGTCRLKRNVVPSVFTTVFQ